MAFAPGAGFDCRRVLPGRSETGPYGVFGKAVGLAWGRRG